MVQTKLHNNGSVSVSNYQYEEDIQIQRGQIRLLKKDYLFQFIKEFKLLMMSEGTVIMDQEHMGMISMIGEYNILECKLVTHVNGIRN